MHVLLGNKKSGEIKKYIHLVKKKNERKSNATDINFFIIFLQTADAGLLFSK